MIFAKNMEYDSIPSKKYDIIPREIQLNRDLSDTQKMLYSVIHGLSKQKGFAYASVRWYAKEIGKQTRYVRRSIKDMEKKGVLQICRIKASVLLIFPKYVVWKDIPKAKRISFLEMKKKIQARDGEVLAGGQGEVLLGGPTNISKLISSLTA